MLGSRTKSEGDAHGNDLNYKAVYIDLTDSYYLGK